jgi:hypothetical protein
MQVLKKLLSFIVIAQQSPRWTGKNIAAHGWPLLLLSPLLPPAYCAAEGTTLEAVDIVTIDQCSLPHINDSSQATVRRVGHKS